MSNPIGTAHGKTTSWSRRLDQPISRQRRTKGNGKNSLGIKRKENFMDDIKLLGGCLQVDKGKNHGIIKEKMRKSYRFI